jgi:two-component system response regulator PilR (NtrC family)
VDHARALEALAAYEFPGNVRELENLLERAFAMGAREGMAGRSAEPHRAHSRRAGQRPPRRPRPTSKDLILWRWP